LYLHPNIFTGEDMTKDEALRLALEALEYEAQKGNDNAYQFERESIKAALEAKDEPVAWRAWVSKFPQGTGSDWVYVTKPIMKDSVHNQPLYTTPPQRKPLTGKMLLRAAQASLSPEQYDHFEAMSKHQPDIYDRLAYSIGVQDE
jgi:hypothetical protein